MASAPAKKILIIEDEKDILQLVKLYLEKEGYRTVTAVTGDRRAGMRKSRRTNPDLIVLDLMLPEMDGLEVCKRLRSSAGNRNAADHHVDGQSRGIGPGHRS